MAFVRTRRSHVGAAIVSVVNSAMGRRELTVEQTGLHSSSLDPGTVRMLSCRVKRGPDLGASVLVGARPVVVGAGGDCDLILNDERVSRRHLELELTAPGVRVKDLGSRNGTEYQGSTICDAVVPVGSTLILGRSALLLEAVESPQVPPSTRESFGGLVGTSVAMREVFALLSLAAPTDATVVIEGESGTGKELAARAIHDHSKRSEGPFVIVDCSALADGLVDSQLFGHQKGAFTGALNDRRGAFVHADGGTLFLDEIGELPLPQQAKLLRALEDRTIQAVGADTRTAVDTRVIVATHRDLGAMVATGEFRFDLFHRLSVVHVRMPPLRDRREDIPTLVDCFYRGRETAAGDLDSANLDRMYAYAWPGNVRELRNVLERAWVLSPPERRAFAALNLCWGGASVAAHRGGWVGLPFKDAKTTVIMEFERRYLYDLVTRFAHNLTRAAEHAGLNRKTLRELLTKHSIQKP